MGFDLYGEKPIQNEFKHQERWDELSSMSYDERESKGFSDEYYTLMSKYEKINPGAYLEIMYGGGDLYGHLFVSIVMIY